LKRILARISKIMAKILEILARILLISISFKIRVLHFEETKEAHSAFSRYVCGTCLAPQTRSVDLAFIWFTTWQADK
jgi:hypothetical protein